MRALHTQAWFAAHVGGRTHTSPSFTASTTCHVRIPFQPIRKTQIYNISRIRGASGGKVMSRTLGLHSIMTREPAGWRVTRAGSRWPARVRIRTHGHGKLACTQAAQAPVMWALVQFSSQCTARVCCAQLLQGAAHLRPRHPPA